MKVGIYYCWCHKNTLRSRIRAGEFALSACMVLAENLGFIPINSIRGLKIAIKYSSKKPSVSWLLHLNTHDEQNVDRDCSFVSQLPRAE